MEGREDYSAAPSLSSSQLIQLAQSHLQLRNFSLCREYALEIQQTSDILSDHNRRFAAQLIAIADILSVASEQNPINWYSILQLDSFCSDLNLMRSSFKNLLNILSPLKEKVKFASDACSFVWQAWNVLSNSTSKEQFDELLKLGLQNQKRKDVNGKCGKDEHETFWTFCPYCYYMYQYARAYEECVLRCQNENCWRAFHGVSMKNAPPTEMSKGKYFTCVGYFPLGYQGTEKDGIKKFGLWSPFVGMGQADKQQVELHVKTTGFGINLNDTYVEISDESEDSGVPAKRTNVEEASMTSSGGNMGPKPACQVSNGMSSKGRHGKSVARNTKKRTGTGKRSRLEENAAAGDRGRDVDSDEDYSEFDNECEESGLGRTEEVASGRDVGDDGIGVNFYEADGEIFVDLPPGDDIF